MTDNALAIKIEFDQSLKEITIEVNNSLTLKSISSLDSINLNIIKQYNSLNLDIEKIEEIDINGIQFALYWLNIQKWEKTSLIPVKDQKLVDILNQTGFQILSKTII